MKCPICAEETAGQETQQWGPELAHKRCVKAYSLGGCDARAAIEAQRVPDDGFAVNFVVHAGLDKQTARKCESIVREMLSSAPSVAQPAEPRNCEWTHCPRRVGDACCNECPAIQTAQQEQPRHLWDGSPMPNYRVTREDNTGAMRHAAKD